jgi:formylglycine-generating enzyme required for sulfatase activity
MRAHILVSLFVLLAVNCGRENTPVTTEGKTSLLKDTPVTTPGQSSPTLETITLETLTLDLGRGVKMELVRIPAGEFLMGSPEDEGTRDVDEGPHHRVRISKPFYMGKYEVTQAQWKAVMGENPSGIQGSGDLPVEQVSWYDSVDFCWNASRKTGKYIRLPSEAEWEYACRAGSTTAYSFGGSPDPLSQYAWYIDNSDPKTHPMGQKKPNRWGLYDMHGNVWEWCADWYGESYYATSPASDPRGAASDEFRVVRGGSWLSRGRDCRSANRYWYMPDDRKHYIGFRVAAWTP